MKIWIVFFIVCVVYFEGSVGLSNGAFRLLQDPSLVEVNQNTGYGVNRYNIVPNSDVEQLVRDIVDSHYVDNEYLRDSLAQLKFEINKDGNDKELNKLLGKYAENDRTHAATSRDGGDSIWEKGMRFLRGLFVGDDNIVEKQQSPKSRVTQDEQTIIDDIEKYLGNIVDRNNGTYEKIISYIVNYVHKNVHFWLFTKKQGGFQDLAIGKQSNISNSEFRKWKKTIVLIHGWINAGDNHYAMNMIKAYDKYGDYNIISVDWSELSYSLYTLSRLSVNFVGPYVAQMINFLAKHHDLRVSELHILGHSLGAHIAGITGMFVKHGKVGHITGFDPAAPLFGDNQKYRLDSSDAKFVDIIHTSLLGMSENIGHVDFYPNGGGPSQPGCGIDIAVCPHRRSYQYYIASMTNNNFLAFPCNSWDDFTAGNCTSEQIHMGIDVPKSSSKGKYYLRTASEAPFALGMKTLENNDDQTQLTIQVHHKRKHQHELV